MRVKPGYSEFIGRCSEMTINEGLLLPKILKIAPYHLVTLAVEI